MADYYHTLRQVEFMPVDLSDANATAITIADLRKAMSLRWSSFDIAFNRLWHPFNPVKFSWSIYL